MMPEGDLPEHPYYCHIDQHPFHLGVVAYIDDVDLDGGGFNVWPGSHKEYYYACKTQYQPTRDEGEPNAEVEAITERVLAAGSRVRLPRKGWRRNLLAPSAWSFCWP